MEELVEGLIKSIGLSNFNSKQIARIQAIAKVPAANLQIECHIHLTQMKIQQFCKEHGITITSYSTRGSSVNTGNAFVTWNNF